MRFVVRVDDLDKVAGAGHDMFWQESLPEEYAAPAAKDPALAKGLSTLRRKLLGEPVAEAHGLQHTDSGIGVVHTALAFAVYMMELQQLEAGPYSGYPRTRVATAAGAVLLGKR